MFNREVRLSSRPYRADFCFRKNAFRKIVLGEEPYFTIFVKNSKTEFLNMDDFVHSMTSFFHGIAFYYDQLRTLCMFDMHSLSGMPCIKQVNRPTFYLSFLNAPF